MKEGFDRMALRNPNEFLRLTAFHVKSKPVTYGRMKQAIVRS